MVDDQCPYLFRDLLGFLQQCFFEDKHTFVFNKSVGTSRVVRRRERRRWCMLQSSDVTMQAMKERKSNKSRTAATEQILMHWPIFGLFQPLCRTALWHIARAITLGLKMAPFLRPWRTLGNLWLGHRRLNSTCCKHSTCHGLEFHCMMFCCTRMLL